MWLRTVSNEPHQGNGNYVNLENGCRLGVNEYQSRQGRQQYRVWLKVANQPAETLRDGYDSREEALSALDEFMSECDFRQLQTPESEQEKVEAEVNGEDDTTPVVGFEQPDGSIVRKSPDPEEVK